MKPVQVTGHVNEDGKLEFDQLPLFPPGEELRVLIMEPEGLAVLEKLIEVVANAGITDPEFLEQVEALDETIWDMQFANSQDTLAKLAEEALAEHKQGKTVKLDFDKRLRLD